MVGFCLTYDQTFLGTALDTQTTVSLPLNVQISLDPVHKKLNVKLPLDVPYSVLNVRSLPHTFSYPYDLTTDVESAVQGMSKIQHPLYNTEEVKQVIIITFLMMSMTIGTKEKNFSRQSVVAI